MAHNFHDINGWLLVGIEMHQGFHTFPPLPMKFWKLTLVHPFTLGDKQQPTVLFNGVPSVTHGHEPTFLWPHLGIIPDPLDALTPLHILLGSHKCWLPRGAVEICGEKSTCCVIGGPLSLNADCWDMGKWPTSLVLNPGTVQTTPTFGDFAMGAVTLAIDLLIDLAFEGAFKLGGALLMKLGGKLLKPAFKKGKELLERGLRAATRGADDAGGLHTVELRVDLERRITRLTGNEEPRVLSWNEDGLERPKRNGRARQRRRPAVVASIARLSGSSD
ncbi:hypothetical protein BE11_26380 [Sorangium cellulosum]|nr:hypothetical protein BE11_26380 [Sorangium cellulosum]